MTIEKDQNDAKLEAMLHAWKVPPPSPWLAQRAVQGIVAAHLQTRQRSLWPMVPLRLAAAVSMAAVIGLVLGLTVPSADDANAANDSDTMIEMMW